MGAGRKTETHTLGQDGQYSSAYGTMSSRNLQKGDLGGVIFGCKFNTFNECIDKKLFGLPAPHMAYIKNIDPGLTLFLFNYSNRTLHGVFEAASEGKLNIDPKAWSSNGTDPSPYPAQVKIRVRMWCKPLDEEKFRPVIAENYKDEKIFLFELDRNQTRKLLHMFSPSPSVRAASTSRDAPQSRKAIPPSSLACIGDLGSRRIDKWSSLFKASDDPSENKGKDAEKGAPRGWEVAAKNEDVRKAQTYEVPCQASEGVKNPWSNASRVQSLRQGSKEFRNDKQVLHPTQKGTCTAANNIIGPSKEDTAQNAYSEIDWDAASSSFNPHLEGLNRILEDPTENDAFNRFASSSYMVPDNWEDHLDTEERNIDKSPCESSSYLSAFTGDDIGDDKEKHRMDHYKTEMGSSSFMNHVLAEVKELKLTQMKQAEYMISLQMELLESRKEILELKRRFGNY